MRFENKVRFAALSIAVVIVFVSCETNSERWNSPVEFPVNAFGMFFESPPQRIVALGSGAIKILCELSSEDKIVGVASEEAEGKYPEAVRCGSSYLPDIEAIVAAEADLLITDMPLSQPVLEKLRQAGIKPLVFEKLNSFEKLQERYTETALMLHGGISGAEIGENAFSLLLEGIDALKEQFSGQSFVFITSRELDTISQNTLAFSVLSRIFKSTGEERMTAEALIAANPDFVFMSPGVTAEQLTSHEGFDEIAAFSSGRTFTLDPGELETAGADMPDLLKAIIGS